MREFHGKHEGDYVVNEDLDLRGTVTGDLTVMAEAELQLHGTVCGNLVVQKDGRAVVRGTVVGVVTNTGGDVEIFGTVGKVATLDGAWTLIDPKAEITTR